MKDFNFVGPDDDEKVFYLSVKTKKFFQPSEGPLTDESKTAKTKAQNKK